MEKERNSQDRVKMDEGAVGEPEWAVGEQKWSLGERWNQFLFQVFILQGFCWVLPVLLCFISWLLFIEEMVKSPDDQVGRSLPFFFCKSMEHVMGRGT